MNEFRQRWTELRPLYRALLVVFAIAALAAVGKDRPFHVIFLTAHPDYALQAFDAEALDYLLKPVAPDRL